LLENETGMHSCWSCPNPGSPVSAGGKRRHPRGDEDTGIGAHKPGAWRAAHPGCDRRRRPDRAAQARRAASML